MKRWHVVTVGWLMALAGAGPLQAAPPGPPPATTPAPVLRSASELQWSSAGKDHQWSSLWGNADQGAHGTMVRFSAGGLERPHWHSADLRAVIVSGTLHVSVENGAAKLLSTARYDDELRRCDDGEWRFTKRHIQLDLPY